MIKELYEELVKIVRNTKLGAVYTRLQEHLEPYKEMVVAIQDVKMEIESPQTYHVTVLCMISFTATDMVKCADWLDKIVLAIEEYQPSSAVSWRVEDIVMDRLGEYILATVIVRLEGVMQVGV